MKRKIKVFLLMSMYTYDRFTLVHDIFKRYVSMNMVYIHVTVTQSYLHDRSCYPSD